MKIQSIPGKGRGAVSSKSLKKGETVLKCSIWQKFECKADRVAVLRQCKAFNELCGTTAAEKLEHNSYSIYRVNGKGKRTRIGSALILEGSYFNHCCYDYNIGRIIEDDAATFFARRDIAEGEELCISYSTWIYPEQCVMSEIDGELLAEARREYLKNQFAFDCTCGQCHVAAPAITICKVCYTEKSLGLCSICDADALLKLIE